MQFPVDAHMEFYRELLFNANERRGVVMILTPFIGEMEDYDINE
jgi:hypothetical protein